MKKSGVFLMIAGFVGLALASLPGAARAQTCTPTGFYRDGINLTAAIINPSATVSGNVDATGCDIGVYYGANTTGAVDSATIYGATYFGVVVNGDDGPASVNVTNSEVYDIGDSPLDGAQHGVGIYYRACASDASSASGSISGNDVHDYQKNGITASCSGTSVSISNNTVTGQGPVSYIAQNGIEVGFGATASVTGNTVKDNQYTGSSTLSTGILIVGGSSWCQVFGLCPSPDAIDSQVVNNVVTNNDGGVVVEDYEYVDSADEFAAPTTPTNNKVVNNTIANDDCTNGIPYQAGIADVGDADKLIHNTISGQGYTTCFGGPNTQYDTGAFTIDTTTDKGEKVHANVLQ